ncbi:hypothetical protein [Kitasatospora sp. NPDC051914]|uniref:hypothetical protein n=1 Tax=Kitasatospora sp. NPDC051914 TaxID=3154945 RepID=UPI00341A50C7
MSVTARTSAFLLALTVGGLGTAACTKDAGPAPKPAAAVSESSVVVNGDGGSVSVNGGSATVSAAPASPAASAAGKSPAKPADLPAGLPLPGGKLTSVTGDAGAYVLTYTGTDVAAYGSALRAAGYDVVSAAGTVSATKGAVSVVVTTIGDGLTVAVSGS